MRWVTIGAIAAVLLASISLIAETDWFKSLAAPSSNPWLSRIATRKENPGDSVQETPNRQNILLIGVDERLDDPGRSDTVMLLSLEPSRRQAALISVPRDTWVQIPKHGWDKINHAYAYGKEALAAETVEHLLGVPVDHFVVINLKGFQKVVDTLGGVTIDVEKRMVYSDPYQDLHIDLYPGVQLLNGLQAMQYVRFRADEAGDIGRIERQQKFIRALANQAFSPTTLIRLPTLINQLSGAVRTDLTPADLIKLVGPAKDAYDRGIKTAVVPGSPRTFYETSYLVPDIAEVRALIASLFELPSPKPEFVQEISRVYQASLPKEQPHRLPPSSTAPSSAQNPSAENKKNTENKKAKDGSPDRQESVTEKTYSEQEPKTETKTETKTEENRQSPSPKHGPVVELIDATGLTPLPGPRYAAALSERGWSVAKWAIWQNPRSRTVIIDRTGDPETSKFLLSLLPRAELTVRPNVREAIGVTIILGQDTIPIPGSAQPEQRNETSAAGRVEIH